MFLPHLEVWIPGKPRPMAQKRAFMMTNKAGKKVARISDSNTAEGWKGMIAGKMMEHIPESPIDVPMSLELSFYLPRPKALMRKKDPDEAYYCIKRPDIDNLRKAVMDALSEMRMWVDDSYVVEGETRKFYTAKNGQPGLELKLSKWSEN